MTAHCENCGRPISSRRLTDREWTVEALRDLARGRSRVWVLDARGWRRATPEDLARWPALRARRWTRTRGSR